MNFADIGQKLSEFGEATSKKFTEFGKSASDKFTEFGESVKEKFEDLGKWDKSTKEVILLIHAVPYKFPHSWVDETFNMSANFQYSTHPNDPIILLPNDRTLTLKIRIPMGIQADRVKYTIIKNVIRSTSWLFATTNTYITPEGIKAGQFLDMYNSYRFPFPTIKKKPKTPVPKDEEDEDDKALEQCANTLKESESGKDFKWKSITDEQRATLQQCVKDKKIEREAQKKEEEKLALQQKEEATKQKCDEESRRLSLTKEERQKEDDKIVEDQNSANIMAKIERNHSFFLSRTTREKTKVTGQKIKAYFKGLFKRNQDGVIPFTKLLSLPWQVQISCAYWGRSTQVACCAITGFNWSSSASESAEDWEITLLGYNFRKNTETDQTQQPEILEHEDPPEQSITGPNASRNFIIDDRGAAPEKGECSPPPKPVTPKPPMKDAQINKKTGTPEGVTSKEITKAQQGKTTESLNKNQPEKYPEKGFTDDNLCDDYDNKAKDWGRSILRGAEKLTKKDLFKAETKRKRQCIQTKKEFWNSLGIVTRKN